MVATANVWVRIEAPVVVPHPFGLFSVASPQSPTDPSWMLGGQWTSTACGDLAATFDACINGGTPGAKTVTARDPWSHAKPFTVYAYRSCAGESAESVADDVDTLLSNGEEFAAEQALWTALTTAAAPTVGGGDLLDALAYVEQLLGVNYFGTGVIHMNRGAATRLAQHLVRVGNHLETIAGTPVAAGAGYDSAAAAAGPAVIYGTGALAVRRSTPDRHTAWNLQVNDYTAIAERTYLVGWDCYAVGISGTV